MPTATRTPRILFWDIETSHNLAAVFRLFGEDFISHENLLQERYIVCAAWQWDGKSCIHGTSVLDDAKRFKADVNDDKAVVTTLHAVLSQADVIVAHNGDKYDIKFYAARALFHGLKPLPPIVSVDTLKVAKSRFLFNSNRLDYLGHFLGLGRKKATPRGLWLDVLRGDVEAIKTMLAYNKQDVVLLKKVYEKLKPYVKTVLSRTGCPKCGSHRAQARGTSRTQASTYQRWQCQTCSGWFRSAKSIGRSSTVRSL